MATYGYELIMYDSLTGALSYVRLVRDTFQNETEKYEMFIEIMRDLKSQRFGTKNS